MTTNGYEFEEKMVRYSEVLAYIIRFIRQKGQEKEDKSIKYYSMYSINCATWRRQSGAT